MSHISDFTAGGVWPLQDHDQDFAQVLSLRTVRFAARITGRHLSGRFLLHDRDDGDTLGDVNCAMFWPRERPALRPTGGWAFAWPAIVTQAADTGRKLKVRPIRRDDFKADDRFDEREVESPDDLPDPLVGTVGIALAGTEEMREERLFFPIQSSVILVAANLPKDARDPEAAYEMGTLVYDLKTERDPDTGEERIVTDPDRSARLQTAWRVVPVERLEVQGQSSIAGIRDRDTAMLAWNLAGTGYAGHEVHHAGLGSMIDVAIPTEGRSTGLPMAVGFASRWAGGPISAGVAKDKHQLGRDRDGNGIGSAHLSICSFFQHDDKLDMPLAFTDQQIVPVSTPSGELEWNQAYSGYDPWWVDIVPLLHTDTSFKVEEKHLFPASPNRTAQGTWRMIVKLPFQFMLLDSAHESLCNPGRTSVIVQPYKNHKVASWNRGDPPLGFTGVSTSLAVMSLVGRAQPQRIGETDLRYSANPKLEDLARLRPSMPVVFNAVPFAAEGGTDGAGGVFGPSAGGFRETLRRDLSPWGLPTANGGLAILPPEVDLIDLTTGVTRATQSTVHWIAAPNAYWGSGRPETIHGGLSLGYRWGDDPTEPGSLVWERSGDVAAAAQTFTQQLRMRSTETVHNDTAKDIDLRIETLTLDHGLHVNASNGVIGIGIDTEYPSYAGWGPPSPPVGSLDVLGSIHTADMVDLALEFQTRATSPAQITSDQNDYNPGRATFVRLSTDAARRITGFTSVHPATGARDGQHLWIINVGNFNLLLTHQDAGSASENRIITPTGGTVTIQPGRSVHLIYDAFDARWRII